eukprot:8333181-Pyramimonas_sp.AAC.1
MPGAKARRTSRARHGHMAYGVRKELVGELNFRAIRRLHKVLMVYSVECRAIRTSTPERRLEKPTCCVCVRQEECTRSLGGR